jgi:hypothetical protein
MTVSDTEKEMWKMYERMVGTPPPVASSDTLHVLMCPEILPELLKVICEQELDPLETDMILCVDLIKAVMRAMSND